MSSRGFTATNSISVKEAKANLTRFLRDLDTIPVEEVTKSANTIRANAIAQAPYKSGKLEQSIYARVSKNKRRPGIVIGASARSKTGYNYAGIQHENTSFHHPIKGKAHFLSDPFNAEVRRLKHRLKSRLKVKNKR